MRINHNLMAMNTHRQLGVTQGNQTKSMEKLSSGLRINRAGDDAAGLAISEKMRGQINGLNQASRNAQDGISLIQTAEGALTETQSILQRMRELAVQSSNDTNTAADRKEIQKEINQLTQEIDRIAETTEFNTKKLLNGNAGATATVDGTNNAAKIDKALVNDATLDSGTYTLNVTHAASSEINNAVDAGTGIDVASNKITIDDATASFGSYQIKVEDDTENSGMKKVTLIDSTTEEEIGSQSNVESGAGGKEVKIGGLTIVAGSIGGNGTLSFDVQLDGESTFELVNSKGDTVATKSFDNLNKSTVEIKGVEVGFNADLVGGVGGPPATGPAATEITISNNALNMEIGANAGQSMNIAVGDMSAAALGVEDIDVLSPDSADAAITTIQNALDTVSAERSKLGSYQNRLEHTISNLDTSSENLQSAESRIRDVDMAQEMMELTKQNILQQAAQSMLAQANQAPQGVLQLLQ
jgi:flagellin